jgi:hypothetical protein
LRIGVITYTNLASGIGVFGWELWHYLGDSILSVASPEKGQEVWTERQTVASRPPSDRSITDYLDEYKPEVVMFLETPFSMNIYNLCRARGIATVAIPMHETFSAKRLVPDLMACTNSISYRQAAGKNRELIFLPIGLELFKYRKRTGHTFVCNVGYGGVHDRRQAQAIIRAFHRITDPDARLILNAQSRWPDGVTPGQWAKDKRITFNLINYPHPSDIYEMGDISILPIAYGGYERTILESMASGMPTLTVAAEPMCLYQHDPRFLIKPWQQYRITKNWVYNVLYNRVKVEDLQEKMEWLLTIDTPKFSERARRQAEAQSWESTKIDYKKTWMEMLKDLTVSLSAGGRRST